MYNQPVCLCAFNACLCMHAVFVRLSLTVCIIIMCMLAMPWICVRMCAFVFMKAQETTNNTMSTKIQCCAFVKVTPIHLAWQQSLYLFSCSHMSFFFSCAVMHPGVYIYIYTVYIFVTRESSATVGCLGVGGFKCACLCECV